MAEVRLIVKTYEESRLEFFKEQLAAAHRRLDWSVKHNPDCYDNAEKGEVVSFYEWAVKMAENPDSLRTNGRWIIEKRHTVSKNPYMDDNYHAHATCSECDFCIHSENASFGYPELNTTNFCPNCGCVMEVSDGGD